MFKSSCFHVENIENGRGVDRGFFSTLAMPAKIYENYDYKIKGKCFKRQEVEEMGGNMRMIMFSSFKAGSH